MKCCPHCGAHVRGGTDCQACGTRATPVRTDGGQGPNDRRDQPQGGGGQGGGQPQGGGQGGGQPRGGGQGQGGRGNQPQGGGQPRGGNQPQGGRQGQQQGGYQGQQYNQQGQQPRGAQQRGGGQGGVGGFSRRQLLIGGGGGLAVLGGLWFFVLGDDGGNPTSSPDSAAEAYVEALNDGDSEQREELVHADSDLQDGGLGDQFLPRFEQTDVSVEGSTVVDEELPLDASNYDSVQEFQLVEVTVDDPEGEEPFPIVVAQNSEGEWKVWSLGIL